MTVTESLSQTVPVTPAQLGMLVYAAGSSSSPVYGIANVFEGDDGISAEAMARAWRAVVAEFAALRGRFEYGPDERWRMVIEPAPGDGQVSTRATERPPTAEELRNLVRQRASAAADPGRVCAIEVIDAGRPIVIWAHHHAIIDGWSKALVLGRVLRHADWFAGRAATPPEPVVDDLPLVSAQFVDAARDRALDEFWHSRLAGAPASLLGEATTARPEQYDVELPVDPTTWQGVTAVARRLGVTVPSVFAAAFGVVLGAFLRRSDVTFGFVTSLRGVVDAADAHSVGLCMNTLPCRVRPSPAESWADLLPRLHVELGAGWRHGAVDLTSQATGLPVSQLADTLLAFQNYPKSVARYTGADAEGPAGLREVCSSDLTNYALAVHVHPAAPGRWTLRLTCDTARVRPSVAAGFADCLHAALTGLAADPDRPIGDTPLTVPGPAARPRPVPDVLTAFDAARDATPDAPAVVCADWRLSYAELDARATGLAAALRTAAVRPGDAVGLLVDHHAEAAVAVLAVLRLSAHYVPLDPRWPPGYLRGLTERVPMAAVVTVAATSVLGETLGLPAVRADLGHDVAERPAPPPAVPAALPAAVLFTSGTTGEAKAVVLTRGGLAALVADSQAVLGGGAVTTVRFARLGFDMSTVDIWLPLSTGGRCVFPHVRTPPPDVFAGYVAAHRPDLVVLPPGYFNLCVDERPALVSGLRHVMVGGEPPSARHAATARRLRPGLAVTNIYGPTEATTYVTGGSVAADPGDIGLPLESVRLHVVDPWLRPLPAGVPGELCVAGPHVALGYHGAGAGTAAVFVPEPGGAPGVRMYRTGDLGYLGRDGRYHLLGRIDRQVKIRGHRVEPAGVEAVLRGSPRVRDVAVVARGGATARMVAFVVPHDRATPDSLARELREALPEYLCPDRIVVAAAIPRTPNGKVDSAALWSAVEALAPGVSDAPVAVGPVAAAVAQVWQDVLGVPFAPDEDFFMLGGNSFLAMRLSMRLDREFGIHLPVRAVLDSRSGSELVRRAERA